MSTVYCREPRGLTLTSRAPDGALVRFPLVRGFNRPVPHAFIEYVASTRRPRFAIYRVPIFGFYIVSRK
ncbi:MAG: hypothetical protein ABI769_18075 [Pseudomonadota bacterium]